MSINELEGIKVTDDSDRLYKEASERRLNEAGNGIDYARTKLVEAQNELEQWKLNPVNAGFRLSNPDLQLLKENLKNAYQHLQSANTMMNDADQRLQSAIATFEKKAKGDTVVTPPPSADGNVYELRNKIMKQQLHVQRQLLRAQAVTNELLKSLVHKHSFNTYTDFELDPAWFGK
jgi:hypothetical protein